VTVRAEVARSSPIGWCGLHARTCIDRRGTNGDADAMPSRHTLPRASAATLLAAPGCGASLADGGLAALNALSAAPPEPLVADAAFGPHPRQRLDVFAPPGATAAPAVVFWYGGGWSSGSRASYRFVAGTLTRRGLVTVLPHYRLFPEAAWPAYPEDGAAAVAWVRANAARIGVDPERIALAGHSAGGHLALTLALDRRGDGRRAAAELALRRDLRRGRPAGCVSAGGAGRAPRLGRATDHAGRGPGGTRW
jgi:acetyl esterase/lipase